MRWGVLGLVVCLVLAACSQAIRPDSKRFLTCTLTDKIYRLPAGGFNAIANGYDGPRGAYRGPSGYVKVSSGSAYNKLADALNVFAAQNSSLTTQLCDPDLAFIFIDEGNQSTTGWGFWENPTASPVQPGGRAFIGISESFLRAYPTITSHENDTVANLKVAFYRGVSYDTGIGGLQARRLALISALAHEMAHIMWVRDSVNANLLQQLNSGSSDCREFKKSWNGRGANGEITRGNPFQDFDQDTGETSTVESIRDIQADVKNGDYVEARKKLKNVYGKGSKGKAMASVFAIDAPVEDFAETYKLAVLLSPPVSLGSIGVRVDTDSVDVVKNNYDDLSSGLRKKVKCLMILYPP
jgi:hypothetical protein